MQAGNAVSFFGYGLILPFEIIYLHQIRGFATATAGLVLAAILGTATLVTPPSGALLDHFRPKPILIAGNLTSALGYAGLPASVRYRNWPDFRVWPVAGLPEGMLSSLFVPDRCRFLRAGGRVMERAAPAQRRRRRP